MQPALLPVDECGVFRSGRPTITHESEGWMLEVSSDYVLAGDLWVPTWAEVAHTGPDEMVWIRAEMVHGSPRITEVRFAGRDLQQRHLTDTDISIVVALFSNFAVTVEEVDGVVVVTPTIGALYEQRLTEMLGRRRNRRVTADVLERIAEVYMANIDGTPTKAVQEAFSVGVRQAGNYVRRARDAGLIPEARKAR